jgi:hypothetical protein
MGPGWAETGFVICSCSAIQSPDWRQQAQGFLGPRTALGCRQYDPQTPHKARRTPPNHKSDSIHPILAYRHIAGGRSPCGWTLSMSRAHYRGHCQTSIGFARRLALPPIGMSTELIAVEHLNLTPLVLFAAS